jgi:hypothetical protein
MEKSVKNKITEYKAHIYGQVVPVSVQINVLLRVLTRRHERDVQISISFSNFAVIYQHSIKTRWLPLRWLSVINAVPCSCAQASLSSRVCCRCPVIILPSYGWAVSLTSVTSVMALRFYTTQAFITAYVRSWSHSSGFWRRVDTSIDADVSTWRQNSEEQLSSPSSSWKPQISMFTSSYNCLGCVGTSKLMWNDHNLKERQKSLTILQFS